MCCVLVCRLNVVYRRIYVLHLARSTFIGWGIGELNSEPFLYILHLTPSQLLLLFILFCSTSESLRGIPDWVSAEAFPDGEIALVYVAVFCNNPGILPRHWIWIVIEHCKGMDLIGSLFPVGLVGGVAQWLGHQSLAGGLSLTFA